MSQSSTILIVDDDPFGRDAVGMVLDSNGYDLIFAGDGPEGIRRASEAIPDLILLDVMMPGMDGFEVCRRLRSDSVLGEVPVLMITALDDRASRLQGIQSGADDFITKPIDSVELLARVQGITRLNRYRHLLNQRHRFEWVLDQSEDGYLLLDQQDRVVYANPTARRYFEAVGGGVALDGRNFVEVIFGRYQREPVSAWESWIERPYRASEPLYLIQPQQVSSPAIWLQVAVLDQTIGAQTQRLVRVQDVSAQMETQQAMWAFQSTVRHKLNTPLHGMASCLELLTAQSVSEIDPHELQDIIGLTKEAMGRLEASIASVLRHAHAPELTRGGSGLPVQQLRGVIRHIATTVNVNTLRVDMTAEVEQAALAGDCLLMAPAALESVITELLENGVKFHPQHDPKITVRIESGVCANGTRAVKMAVMDDGISLSPIQLERMWAPYYQSERVFTGEVPGMGLGLSLVRSLLWQVGGQCSAANRGDGPGLVMEVTLPVGHAGNATPATTQKAGERWPAGARGIEVERKSGFALHVS